MSLSPEALKEYLMWKWLTAQHKAIIYIYVETPCSTGLWQHTENRFLELFVEQVW